MTAYGKMQAQVFPEFSVKQAFKEVQVERDDDTIIASVQNELLTRCLTSVLKGAITSCVNSKRKYISVRDLKYATSILTIPRSSINSKDVGYLLDTRHFGKMCTQHTDMILDLMKKYQIQQGDVQVKISSDALIILQEEVEAFIRGFLEKMASEGKHANVYGFRLFDSCMRTVTGEPVEETQYAVL